MIDNKFKTMFENAMELAGKAIISYEPTVSDVCNRFEKNKNVPEDELEHLLDGMLDFCFDDRMLELFHSVCKSPFAKYLQLVTDYIHTYKELWDSE